MQIGVATGIYSGTMNFTAGLGGGLSFPLSQSPLGFRLSLSFWIILAIIAAMVVFVIVLQGGVRKIPVQYSKKIQGRKQVGGQSSHIPLKVNTGGVIPVIFAQSLMQTPVIIASILKKGEGTGIGSQILKGLSQSNWCNPSQPVYSIGLVVYIALIIAFAYFYTSITFNPLEIANNMKKQGGFIPGIRRLPGSSRCAPSKKPESTSIPAPRLAKKCLSTTAAESSLAKRASFTTGS